MQSNRWWISIIKIVIRRKNPHKCRNDRQEPIGCVGVRFPRSSSKHSSRWGFPTSGVFLADRFGRTRSTGSNSKLGAILVRRVYVLSSVSMRSDRRLPITIADWKTKEHSGRADERWGVRWTVEAHGNESGDKDGDGDGSTATPPPLRFRWNGERTWGGVGRGGSFPLQ